MNQPQYTTPSGRKSSSGWKTGPKYSFHIHVLEQKHCFTCPLHDCLGERHPACPIAQERARKRQAQQQVAA